MVWVFLDGRYDNGWEGGWHRFDGTLEKRAGDFGLELLLSDVCIWWLRKPGGDWWNVGARF